MRVERKIFFDPTEKPHPSKRSLGEARPITPDYFCGGVVVVVVVVSF